MDDKTSLEKSHSKWSNFLLTCLCILITLTISALWILLCFFNYFKLINIILIGTGLLIFLIILCYLMIKFKR